MKQICKISLVILLLAIPFHGAFAKTVKIYTSVFPPIVTDDPGRPGYAYEIVSAIFTEADIPFEIIQLPWARAQHILQQTPEALIFPLTRTPTREDGFNWGFELFKTQTHFISVEGKQLTPESAHEKRIGVQLKSSWDNWLTEKKYEKVYRIPHAGRDIAKMLKVGRLDAWYAERSVAKQILPEVGIENAVFSAPVQIFDTYLASNKDKPFPEMRALKEALEAIIFSGRYKEIMKRYNVD